MLLHKVTFMVHKYLYRHPFACHNQVWEMAGALMKAGANPDKLSREALVAELTNHLIADVVLSPGAIGTLPELLSAGFTYAK